MMEIMRAPGAEHLIRRRVTALSRALPAAKAGDATSLHQARVATRRLRAALPLVASGDKTDKLARSVRRLTRALGPVRELDVALEILDELERREEVPRAGIERLRQSIQEERRRLQAEAREQIDDFDLDKLRKRALAVARRLDDEKTPREAGSAVATDERAARRARRLAAAIDSAAGLYLPDRLHEVRIAVKKLRYTLELGFADLGRSAARASARLRILKNAQDLLGRTHDLEVLIARTRSIQSSPGASTLKVSADLDRLVRRLETECRQLHGHYMAVRPALLSLCHRLMAAGKPRERARRSVA
jgi:CHAD domain-containing protein